MLAKIKRIINVLRGINTVNIDALKTAGLNVGIDCKIQDGVVIDFNHCQHIFIGNSVTIAPQVYILAHDASTFKLFGYTKIGKVIIEDNVFIGARSIIMPGVRIGKNSIIGAGSVVVSEVPANFVYAGNPARAICDLTTFVEKQKELFDSLPRFGEKYTRRNRVSVDQRRRLNNEMNLQMKEGFGFIE